MMKIRIRFKKNQEVRFISHLSLAKTLRQAVSRAGLPIAYSCGFNPHQKISLCPPLPLGMTSGSEFADLLLAERSEADEVKMKLNEKLPTGIEVLEAKEIPLESKSLSAVADAASYEIILGDRQLPVKKEPLDQAIPFEDTFHRGKAPLGGVSFKDSPVTPIEGNQIASLKLPNSYRNYEIPMLPAIGTMSYKDLPEPTLNITVKIPGMRIKDVLNSLLGLDGQEVELLEVKRTGIFARRGENLISLMDICLTSLQSGQDLR